MHNALCSVTRFDDLTWDSGHLASPQSYAFENRKFYLLS